jgi:hypothetical protein
VPEEQKPSLHIYLSGKQSRLEVIHAVSLKSCLVLGHRTCWAEISDGTQNESGRLHNKIYTT